MFEEVPRERRGLAVLGGISTLTARRVVLGPFVIGGGVLLAFIGGSVAVAATVFTASTIRASDVPPRPGQLAAVPAPGSSSAHPHPAATTAVHSFVPLSTAIGPSTAPVATAPAATQASTAPSAALPGPVRTAVGSGSASAVSSAQVPLFASPSSTPSPAGNALIYIRGWDSTSHRLDFQFAAVSKGTGPGGSDVYSVESATQYTAGLASDLSITSGGSICPPAGNKCTVAQLSDAAVAGFYAVVAIDPSDELHSIIEVDNVTAYAPSPPPPSPSAALASPSASATPALSTGPPA
jgi:hypothetical protein